MSDLDDRSALRELVRALAEARPKFAPVTKDGANPHLNNRYATLGAVLDAVAGPLAEVGIVVTQTPVPLDGGTWALQTTLRHVGGGELTGLVPLITGEARGLNPMQALGSAISYARRYGLLAILCLTAEDDDGASAGHPPAPARESSPPRRGSGPSAGPRPIHAPNGERRNAPPKTGAQLYRRLKEANLHETLEALQEWGQRQEPALPERIVEWPAAAIPAAWTFTVGDARARREQRAREEAEIDALAARDGR